MIKYSEQRSICSKAMTVIRKIAPVDTGNLRKNAIKLVNQGNGVWQIVVDIDVAPYMPYTNEPWISPKWNGKQNPNEGWWDFATQEAIKNIQSQLGGTLELK